MIAMVIIRDAFSIIDLIYDFTFSNQTYIAILVTKSVMFLTDMIVYSLMIKSFVFLSR